MAAANYFHTVTAQTNTLVSGNAGVLLRGAYINQVNAAASTLTIFDAATAAQATAANTVVVLNAANAAIIGTDYNVVMSRGIMISISAGTATTPDVTITFQ